MEVYTVNIMEKIYKILWLKIFVATIIAILISIALYLLLKVPVKVLLTDVMGAERKYLSQMELPFFIAYTTILSAILSISIIRKVNSTQFNPSFKIMNQIKAGAYHPEDYKKIESFYKLIRTERTSKPKKFYDLPRYYPKSVYALTGGWRAGKTTASGMLLDIINKDKEIKVVSETYHDCFSFGNIDESISSFFKVLAIKTSIPEFNKLGQVSTPGLDMSINFGGFSIKKAFSNPILANEIRAQIFKDLSGKDGIHIVLIDDIDRLKPEEQYQWLKVIELLGKFNHKLVIILPIHIEEVTKNLSDTFKLNPQYIDKIIPLNNRLQVGVDVEYIKSLMSVSSRSTNRIKRIYTKYLISIGLRESISKQSSNIIQNKSEWFNEIYRGGISEIAYVFSQNLPTRNSSDGNSLSILNTKLDHTNTIWFTDQRNFEDSYINNLIWTTFLTTNTRGDDTITDQGYRNLRSVSLLHNIFDNQKYQIAGIGNYGRSPEIIDDSAWRDYWIEVLWPIARTIRKDKHISQYLTYQDIDREIALLMKTESELEERNVLSAFILERKF